MSFYNRLQIAGDARAELFKGLGSQPESDITRNIRRFLEISRNREEAKGWNRIEKRKWGCERSSPPSVAVSHENACTATGWRRPRFTYLFHEEDLTPDRWKTSWRSIRRDRRVRRLAKIATAPLHLSSWSKKSLLISNNTNHEFKMFFELEKIWIKIISI